jgi:hypothetical protein
MPVNLQNNEEPQDERFLEWDLNRVPTIYKSRDTICIASVIGVYLCLNGIYEWRCKYMGLCIIRTKDEYENIYLEHPVLLVGGFLRIRDVVISILGP